MTIALLSVVAVLLAGIWITLSNISGYLRSIIVQLVDIESGVDSVANEVYSKTSEAD